MNGLTEIGMERQANRDAIADEAIGQRHGSNPPEARRESDKPALDEVARMSKSTGVDASIPEKTAESLGERIADAYSDPDLTKHPVWIGRRAAEGISSRFEFERLMTLVTGFALGYLAAEFLHGRINAFTVRTPKPFQITHPPQRDRHPQGFVQSAVLKTITEHPQGMTTAGIIAELGCQGIGRQSIEDALGVLLRAKKVGMQGSGGKYNPAAPEVPTAPDQPSS